MSTSSAFRNRFIRSYGSKDRPEMTLVCYYYLDAVQEKYAGNRGVLPLCRDVNSVKYKVIKG